MSRRALALVLAACACWLVVAVSPASAAYVIGGQWGSQGAGQGQFDSPTGLAVSPVVGNVYVTDSGNHRVQVFSPAGAYIDEWGSQGAGQGEFQSPAGIELDSLGNVYVADRGNHRIQKFSSTGMFIDEWGTNGTGQGEFNQPWGIATDADDNPHVSDSLNSRIQVFDPTGGFLAEWGQAGGADGQFDNPRGLAIGPGGDVYVADFGNDRLQSFNAAGGFLDDYPNVCFSICVALSDVQDVAADASGSIFITIPELILKVTPGGIFIARFGISGAGAVIEPRGIDVAASGRVYVADAATDRVQWYLDDVVAPVARIVAGPRKRTRKRRARFRFRSNEAGSSFSCKLDRRAFRPCSSPRTYRKLRPGRHTFRVRAIDRAGNQGKAVKRRWRVRRPKR